MIQVKALDLTGQRFGRLIAKKPAPNRGNRRFWECQCDCGNTKAIGVSHLRSGATTHCGCVPKKQSSLFVDETGNRYSYLTVIEQVQAKTSGASWRCKCDCGKETIAWGSHLRNGNTTSCGACARSEGIQKARNVMVPGKRYGRLTCLEMVSLQPVRWTFKCDCGWEGVKNHHQVAYGHLQGCGCQVGQSQVEDLEGKRFGSLTVKSLSDDVWVHVKTGKKRVKWSCECDCGNRLDVLAMALKRGSTSSCGCLTKGDESIGAWLEGNFRLADDDSHFYVFSLANHPGICKPGIAKDMKHRADEEYGELYDFIAMARLDTWLIEQAVLQATQLMHKIPAGMADWDGASELRQMSCEAVFDQALYYEEQLREMGRERFAIAYLPTTPAQRTELERRAA